MMPRIDIDSGSGFCFGVVTAIQKAEEELSTSGPLFCLGDIVHNSAEVRRLETNGLRTITHADLNAHAGARVLLRAHGEPPSTYETARRLGITLVDATCPVVLKLQQRIKTEYDRAKAEGRDLQIVIYGHPGHAEVNGLVGQTGGEAIVVESLDEIDKIDFSRDIALYSQTTKSPVGFSELVAAIDRRRDPSTRFTHYDTICRQVSNRSEKLREFAKTHDVICFVAGEKSSNGRVLLAHCQDVNPRSYLVPDPSALRPEWFDGARSIGICGATSTPRWLMEQVAEAVGDLCG